MVRTKWSCMTTAAVESSIWTHRHLFGIADLSVAEIYLALDTAERLLPIASGATEKSDMLRGRTVANLFFEESTRTRTSFTCAAQRLSADVLEFSAKTSSTQKGESLRDTGRTIDAMGVDFLVVRHSKPGAAHLLADSVHSSVINAGDGAREHPTQALLDLFTIRQVRR